MEDRASRTAKQFSKTGIQPEIETEPSRIQNRAAGNSTLTFGILMLSVTIYLCKLNLVSILGKSFQGPG